MQAADIPDREVLMVVAAMCDHGWEFLCTEYIRSRVSESEVLLAHRGWQWDERQQVWVRYASYTHGGPGWSIGVSRWDIGVELWEYPEKVLLAKLRKLVRRRLLDGCPCGCRGDFVITEAGRALLAAQEGNECL